jgi:hypothetical protein
MKRLTWIALAVATLPLVAHAQSCPTSEPNPAVTWQQWKFTFEPTSWPTIRRNDAGVVAWWYGPPRADGTKPISFAYLAASAATPSYFAALAGDVVSQGPTAAFKARRTLTRLDDPVSMSIWCPFYPEMVAGAGTPTTPPPAPAWTVAKNGVSATRPAYKLTTDGLVSTSIRATVGVACDCSAPYVKSGTTYCPFTGAPVGIVAVCSKP